MKTLVDQDIAVSLHSDTPVGVPSPLLEVWVAVNRIGFDSGKVRAPAERVDVARAMRMVTVDAAYTLGQEDNIGIDRDRQASPISPCSRPTRRRSMR